MYLHAEWRSCAIKLDWQQRCAGGAVVCSGANCRATFEDTKFDRCSLMMLSAALTTLFEALFSNMAASKLSLIHISEPTRPY